MKLVGIKILKYKSIVNPIEITFNNNGLIAFIGKNGCGKTNLLRALKSALSKNSYGYDKEELEAEYVFRFTEEEKRTYFADFDFKDVDELLTIKFNGKEPDIKRIHTPLFKVCIKQFKDDLLRILTDYKNAAQIYLEKLKLIESENPYRNPYDFTVKAKYGLFVMQKDLIDNLENRINQQIIDIEKLFDFFSKDEIEMNAHGRFDFYCDWWQIDNKLPFYKIVENEIALPPLIAECLNLKADDIEEGNRKISLKIQSINEQLEESYQNINNLLEEYAQLNKKIKQIFCNSEEAYDKQEDALWKRQTHFINLVRETAFAKCYYIDNESLLFYSKKKDDYDYQEYYISLKRENNINSRNPILEAADNFLKENDHYKDDESILHLEKLDKVRISNFVKILNEDFLSKLTPKFEKEENISYKFKYFDRCLNLFVIENGSQEININDTSLGRRWYLTYKFVSQLIKRGDYLFIDEPAAFLHPSAQCEIKKELEKISENGIKVFITTHSPYMIPKMWRNVISLSNTENGTEAKCFDSKESLSDSIVASLGDIRSSDILFNLSKTLLLVEGETDKACIEKFADLLQYRIDNYHIHVCDGDSIVQMSYLCIKKKIKFIAIADNDNLYKDKCGNYIKGHPNYKKCLDEMTKNERMCFFIGEGEKGCLEDFFIDEDRDKFLFENDQNKTKISRDKIVQIENIDELNDNTVKNFEDLFRKIKLQKNNKQKKTK